MSGAKFDPAYSFRSSEALRQQAGRRQRRRPPAAGSAPSFNADGQRPCARGDWCASSRTITDETGTWNQPLLGSRAFCDRDRDFVARCLTELPEQYVRLTLELGTPQQGNSPIRIPFGPRLPLRIDIDALLRLIAESLTSWHERVADIDSLTFPATHRRDAWAVGRAVDVLAERVSALLALEPMPMSRAWSLRSLDALPEGATGVVRSVYVDATLDLGGGDAGLEIINLRHLARAVLGETKARPEELVGVPCRDPDGTCGWRSVYRAELPSHEGEPEWWTECARCGDRMSEKTYREWVALCAAYERNTRRKPATLENLPGVA